MTQETAAGPSPAGEAEARARIRASLRELALKTALKKRELGAPSYTIPEAAALCSVSQEHMYRLVRIGAFPAIRMARGGQPGRYVVPARAIEQLLNDPATAGGSVEVAAWARAWDASAPSAEGGVS
jgi:Helix-turn-helix domain